jgi:Tfp pilus assembly protein PilE
MQVDQERTTMKTEKIIRPSRKTIQGLSLMELAIVIAIIGVMLGGLWVALNQAWESSKRETAKEMIATTVTNMRSFFGAKAGVDEHDKATLTKEMIAAGVIPASLVRATTCTGGVACADNPWGPTSGGGIDTKGTFQVCYWDITLAGAMTTCPTSTVANTYSATFGIALTGLNIKSCISLVQAITSPGGPPGLVEVNINTVNLMRSGKAIQPVTDTEATNNCKSQTDGNVVITFIYRVTG